MSKDRNIERQFEILDDTQVWQWWRHLDPKAVTKRNRLTIFAASRLQSAFLNVLPVYPKAAESIEMLVEGDLECLFPALAHFPVDLEEQQFARLDMRMSLVLFTWLNGVSGRYSHYNPLAPRMLARALLDMADALPVPAAVKRCLRRKDRSTDDARHISIWRKERRRLIHCANAWAQVDGLSDVFAGNDREAVADFSTLRQMLKRLEDAERGLWNREKKEVSHEERAAVEQAPALAPPEEEKKNTQPMLRVLTTAPSFKGGSRDSLGDESERKRWLRLAEPMPLFGAEVLESDILAERLQLEFPWLTNAVDHIRFELGLMKLRDSGHWFRMRPLLLVGEPGTGKTRFARRVAELAGLPYRLINVGGAGDNRDLQGTAKGWSTAEPSGVLRAIRDGGAANPILVVDEVEKAASSRRNGRVVDTLLSLLEPETNRNWFDECLCVPCDVSQVNWILTANSLAGIPPALMNRVSVVPVASPSVHDFDAILAGLKADIVGELGVQPENLPELLPEAEATLRVAFADGKSIRKIKAALLSAIGAGMVAPRTIH